MKIQSFMVVALGMLILGCGKTHDKRDENPSAKTPEPKEELQSNPSPESDSATATVQAEQDQVPNHAPSNTPVTNIYEDPKLKSPGPEVAEDSELKTLKEKLRNDGLQFGFISNQMYLYVSHSEVSSQENNITLSPTLTHRGLRVRENLGALVKRTNHLVKDGNKISNSTVAQKETASEFLAILAEDIYFLDTLDHNGFFFESLPESTLKLPSRFCTGHDENERFGKPKTLKAADASSALALSAKLFENSARISTLIDESIELYTDQRTARESYFHAQASLRLDAMILAAKFLKLRALSSFIRSISPATQEDPTNFDQSNASAAFKIVLYRAEMQELLLDPKIKATCKKVEEARIQQGVYALDLVEPLIINGCEEIDQFGASSQPEAKL